MPSFRKRGDNWVFIIDIGRDLLGKRKQKTFNKDDRGRLFETEREARKYAMKIEEQISSGRKFDPVTLQDFATEYFSIVVKDSVEEVTYESQWQSMRDHVLPYLGKFKLEQINDMHIEHLYKKLMDKGVNRGTIRNVSIVLRKTFKHALKKKLIAESPMKLVDTPRYKPEKPNVWTMDDVSTFLSNTRESKFHALYTLACATGMRRGELMGLTWDRVDFTRGTITINQALKYTAGSKKHVKGTKTDNSRRTINVPKFALDRLIEHKQKQMPGVNIVFDNFGEYYWVGEASRQFLTDCKGLRLPQVTFHGLRHAHATHLLQMGWNAKVVAERLGDTVDTILRTYAHVLPSTQIEVAASLENIFGNGDKL